MVIVAICLVWQFRDFHFFMTFNGLQNGVSKSLNPNPQVAADFSLRSVATYQVAAAIAIT